MKNYIEEFMKDNDLKVGDKFNITKSKYCLNNPYHISKIDDSCKLYDDEEEYSNDNLLLELVLGKSQIEKIKKGKWIPEKGELYWFVSDNGSISHCYNEKDSIDDYRLKNLRCFKTEEETEKYKEIMEFVNEKKHDFTIEEWENIHVDKYFISYNFVCGDINIYSLSCESGKGDYFQSKKDCQDIIDKFPKEDLLKYYLNVEVEEK